MGGTIHPHAAFAAGAAFLEELLTAPPACPPNPILLFARRAHRISLSLNT